jgi:hypothetical protein
MEKALGIGGVFFRSKDPKSLSDWYRTHLGIGEPPYGIWSQEPGPTIFAPFAEKTGYFGRDSQQFMLNFPGRRSDRDDRPTAGRRHRRGNEGGVGFPGNR